MKLLRDLLSIVALAMLLGGPGSAHAQRVRAVLFFSPTCPHCEQVINQDLPIFFGMYGGQAEGYGDEGVPERERYVFLFSNGQLEILLVDASRRLGGELFQASFETHGKPSGVPRLIMDRTVLVGSIEIPNRLHGLIQTGIAEGGQDWPEIPGLRSAVSGIPQAAPLTVLAQRDPEAADTLAAVEQVEPAPVPEVPEEVPDSQPPVDPEPAATEPSLPPEETVAESRDEAPPDTVESVASGVPVSTEPTVDTSAAMGQTLQSVTDRRPSMLENFGRDPVGNGMSVLVLLGMVASLLLVSRFASPSGPDGAPGLAVPVLSAMGIAVAAYLTYIEVGQVTAVCGPVGDCNTVNQSEYAKLFGIPVGVLGLAGYAAIIAAWLAARWGAVPLSHWAKIALFGGTVLGTLFSVYLTFLEPFVIGATCAWCLTSAVIITALMWLSAKPAAAAWDIVKGGSGQHSAVS